MGETFGPKVKYECFDDCRQEGCPGHVMRFGYSRTSDVEFFEIDGRQEYHFDRNMLKAALESMRKMEAVFRGESVPETPEAAYRRGRAAQAKEDAQRLYQSRLEPKPSGPPRLPKVTR